MALPFRLFSVCPRISKRKGKLTATTAWRVRILTLGLRNHTVVVDPKKGELTIRRRRFWFFPSRSRIKFGWVEALTYGYRDLAITSSWPLARDSVDLFSAGLRLHGGDELHLFNFFGDGTFSNDGPLPNWLHWDDHLFDMSGTQERESHAFVGLLGKMIGVSVVPASS